MTVLRPITPIFRSNPKRTRADGENKIDAPINHALVLVKKPARARPAKLAHVGPCGFAAQVFAGPARRGLKACMLERNRYVEAYRPLTNPMPPNQQKWA